ncbi:thioredoxin [Blochmannia endosymbiont of Polyrhachis (Hedomyrma) turneri]|uniref:thioredoxin n=1 Tax=Blochmannia endosymbiont of Polyrhachis (Hedomyrma) turneri TaxID=1505596 RepID=UPI00061A7317|nr:thioredoxin [Blochmannia endosymbiont of Polyrhachis (Hedomyrma) turneri]AKC60141.1 thioredoxin-1 [Blochmannia endosymbiont of Polyrhachis (Hedomyrma) turneri]
MIETSLVLVLNDVNFDSYLQAQENKLFLVDFWAEWCNPCKIFSPVFDEIAIEYHETVQFGKFNVDGNSLTVKKYNIRSIPTLLLFRKCVMISSKIGVLSKKELCEFLNINL